MKEIKDSDVKPSPPKKPLFFYYLVALIVLMLLNVFLFPSMLERQVYEVPYSQFLDMVDDGRVTQVALDETNREISEMAGKETVSILTFNESRGTMNSSTRNWNVVERDLIQSAEVGKMPRDEAIVLIAGANPLRDRKFDIEDHRRWREVYPGHPGASHRLPFDYSEYMERRDA